MLLAKAILLVQDLACRPNQICTFFPSTNYFPVLPSRLTSHLICLTVSKPFWGSRNKTWLKSRKGNRGTIGHSSPCTSQNPVAVTRQHQSQAQKAAGCSQAGIPSSLCFPLSPSIHPHYYFPGITASLFLPNTIKIVQMMYSLLPDQDLFRLLKWTSKSHAVITPLCFYGKV